MSFFQSNGFDLFYQVFDHILPEDTLFLHGNLASSQWWKPCHKAWQDEKILNGDSPSSKMIVMDWRGCGQSSAPRDASEVSVEAIAQDVIHLLDHLNLSKVNIVGHSTGGIIALKAMALKPDLFGKAVLLDSVGAKGVKFDASMDEAFAGMAQDKELTAAVIGSTIYQNNPEGFFFREVIVEDAFRAVKQLKTYVLLALKDIDLTSAIKSLSHPCLVLHGEHDLLLPKKDSVELADQLTHGSFQEIAGQGHCCNVENPARLVKIINNFLF